MSCAAILRVEPPNNTAPAGTYQQGAADFDQLRLSYGASCNLVELNGIEPSTS